MVLEEVRKLIENAVQISVFTDDLPSHIAMQVRGKFGDYRYMVMIPKNELLSPRLYLQYNKEVRLRLSHYVMEQLAQELRENPNVYSRD